VRLAFFDPFLAARLAPFRTYSSTRAKCSPHFLGKVPIFCLSSHHFSQAPDGSCTVSPCRDFSFRVAPIRRYRRHRASECFPQATPTTFQPPHLPRAPMAPFFSSVCEGPSQPPLRFFSLFHRGLGGWGFDFLGFFETPHGKHVSFP